MTRMKAMHSAATPLFRSTSESIGGIRNFRVTVYVRFEMMFYVDAIPVSPPSQEKVRRREYKPFKAGNDRF